MADRKNPIFARVVAVKEVSHISAATTVWIVGGGVVVAVWFCVFFGAELEND